MRSHEHLTLELKFSGNAPEKSKMGGSLENHPSDRGLFSCAIIRKKRELFLTGAKEAEGGATSCRKFKRSRNSFSI